MLIPINRFTRERISITVCMGLLESIEIYLKNYAIS